MVVVAVCCCMYLLFPAARIAAVEHSAVVAHNETAEHSLATAVHLAADAYTAAAAARTGWGLMEKRGFNNVGETLSSRRFLWPVRWVNYDFLNLTTKPMESDGI